jgi:CubicO group peptidase (beta-lactamase class C family)
MVSVALCATICAAQPQTRRTDIPVSSPESQGFSSVDLAAALEVAHARGINVHSVTVLRNDRVVLDAYVYPYTREMRHDVASVTKSITALLTALAITDGHFKSTAQPIVETLPPVSVKDERVNRIRIGDLLSMQSGLECGFRKGEPELVEMRKTGNWVESALNLPIVAEPGSRFGYCSPNFHLLSAAIANRTGRNAVDYAKRRLFAPLAITDVYWPADAMGINHGWGDLQLRPIDMAKIGLLLLQGGRWGKQQLLPEAWVDRIKQVHARVNESEDYGLGWWISRKMATLFEANGRGGQRITIIPAKNIVVVMTGGGFEPGEVGTLLLRALRSDSALPSDRAGEDRLQAALRRVSAPPEVRPVSRSPIAQQVSGKRYAMAENRLSLSSVSIEFSDSATAVLRLRLADGTALDQTLGLDGVYRLSPGQYRGTSAGRGEWLPDGRFRAELNTLTRVNRYIFDMEFRGDSIRISASEPTELGTVTLTGVASGN